MDIEASVFDHGDATCSRDWIRRKYSDIQDAAYDAQEIVKSAAGGDGRGIGALREMLVRFADQYEEHLCFEAEMLVPRLQPVEPWGAARAQRLIDQHVRVRQYLDQLRYAADQERTGAPAAIAAESALAGIVAALEENARDLLVAEVTNDDPVVVDQLTD